MNKSILTKRQQHEYADALRDGVPEAVIKEFADRLDAYMATWEAKLRAAVARGDPHVLLSPDGRDMLDLVEIVDDDARDDA